MKTDAAGNTLRKETTIDGVTYELWNTGGGRMRVLDADCGEVITTKTHPDYDKMEAIYNEAVGYAERMAAS